MTKKPDRPMSLQYYRFFPGDYGRDTRFLSMMQHGAYRQLIDEYMVHGPIPNDLIRTYRTCVAFSSEEQAAVKYVLEEFFLLDGPFWRHKRCDEELDWQHKKSEKAAKSINRRWEEERQKRHANAIRTYNERTTNEVRTKYERNTTQNHTKTPREVVGLGSLVVESVSVRKESVAKTAAKNLPPFQAIVDLYHKILPTLPHVAKLTDVRRQLVAKRWREDLGTLVEWEKYFEIASRNDWVMGRTPPGKAHPNWKANFEWLVKEGNMVNLVERHNG